MKKKNRTFLLKILLQHSHVRVHCIIFLFYTHFTSGDVENILNAAAFLFMNILLNYREEKTTYLILLFMLLEC